MGKNTIRRGPDAEVAEALPSGLPEAVARCQVTIRSPRTTPNQLSRAWVEAGDLGDLQLAYDGHRRLLTDCQAEYEHHFLHLAYHADLFRRFACIAAPACEPEVAEQLQAEAMELVLRAIDVGTREWGRCPVPQDEAPDAPVRLMFQLHTDLGSLQQDLGFPPEVVAETMGDALRWTQVGRRLDA